MQYLLSSSADETVRLWQVGSDHCLGVFKHSNYGMQINDPFLLVFSHARSSWDDPADTNTSLFSSTVCFIQ